MTEMNIVDTNPESTSNAIKAQKGHVQALAFARKGSTALSSLLSGIAIAKATERMGAIQTMLFLETTYSDDEQSAIPVVGSKMGETGNLPYDRYTSTVQTADGPRKVPGSWYTDAVKATDYAHYIAERIQFCEDATVAGCPEDISNMGTGERAVEKKRLRVMLSDMRTALTKGAMLLHQAAEIAAVNPDRIKVKMPIRMEKGDDGKPVAKVFGNLIRLQDPAGELEDKVLTVSQFTALKPDKIEGEKTIVSLEKTGNRAPKSKLKTKGKQDIAVPNTVEGFLNLCNVISTAIDNGTDEGRALESKLLAEFAKAGDKGDDAAVTVGTACLAFDNMWTIIEARVNGINARKAAALNSKSKHVA